MNGIGEKTMRGIFALTACVSVAAVVLICLFLFASGVPTLRRLGPFRFLLGRVWEPEQGRYGVFPMLLASVFTTAGALLIGVPLGVLCAVFLARFCPRGLYRMFKPAVGLLSGIPSIVYGFFGLTVLVPLMRRLSGVSGKGLLTASILLAVMILPTVIQLSEAALRAVPESCYEGALALGATKEQSVFFAVLPAARSGIVAGAALGVGRAVGEATAVWMVAGNQPILPNGLLGGVRTLTTNIVLEMGYASGLHREALIACGMVLFVFILLLNLCVSALKRA